MANKPRNDSMLSSGLSSAVDRRRLQKQEELHNKKKQASEAMRASLSEQGRTIVEWIDQELLDVNDFSKMTTEFNFETFMQNTPLAQKLQISEPQLLQAMTIARLMHIDFLTRARTKAKKIMKEPKVVDGERLEFGDE